MRTKEKVCAVILAVCVVLGACTGDEIKSNNGIVVTSALSADSSLVGNIPCEFPMVHDDTTLNVLCCVHDNTSADDVFVWQKYEEMTGIKVIWTSVAKSDRREAVTNALSNGTDLDLILRCKIGNETLMQYGSSGYIIDLAKDDLLAKNAPNCWAYMQTHPDTLASIMNPDGTIYALPQVNSGEELRVSRKIFINKEWLERVHMDLPTTTEEFYELLTAFKEQDANGNGDPDDEIPFCPIDWSSVQDCFFGAFGIGNRGAHNMTVDWDEDQQSPRLVVASDGYKDFLQYMNRLYSEDLMDRNVNTITTDQWQNNALNDRIGVFGSTNLASLPAGCTDKWVAIEEALEGPNGDKIWSPIRANFASSGAALIPCTCEDPALVLQWLDYFWTDEGTLFYHMGIEGETFVASEDGAFDYAPAIYEEMSKNNMSFDDEIAGYSPYPGGSNPTVEIAPYFGGGEVASVPAHAAVNLFKYRPDEIWPSFTFSPEETETLNLISYDISKYSNTCRVEFLTGEKSFDEWNNYTKQIHDLGEDDMLAIYQAAIDRYHDLQNK